MMKCEPSDTFNDLLANIGMCSDSQRVASVLICKNEKFVGPVHEVPLGALVVLCEQYGQNVCYYFAEEERMSTSALSLTQSVFEVLMNSSHERLQYYFCNRYQSCFEYCMLVVYMSLTLRPTDPHVV